MRSFSVFPLADPLAVVAPMLRSQLSGLATVHTTIKSDYRTDHAHHVFLTEVAGASASTNGPEDLAQDWIVSVTVDGFGRDETRSLALSCRSVLLSHAVTRNALFDVIDQSYPTQVGTTWGARVAYSYQASYTLRFAAQVI